MNNPISTDGSEMVRVTQADYDAAIVAAVRSGNSILAEDISEEVESVALGIVPNADVVAAVQEAARHRIIAVNHHQALVDALREARDLFRKLETSRGTRGYIQSRSRLGASRIDTLLTQIGAA